MFIGSRTRDKGGTLIHREGGSRDCNYSDTQMCTLPTYTICRTAYQSTVSAVSAMNLTVLKFKFISLLIGLSASQTFVVS